MRPAACLGSRPSLPFFGEQGKPWEAKRLEKELEELASAVYPQALGEICCGRKPWKG